MGDVKVLHGPTLGKTYIRPHNQMNYLLLPREVRTDHIDLMLPCETGETVTAEKLASFLGLDQPPSDIACLCGTNCSNPRHFFFIRKGEKSFAHGTACRNRIRLVIEKFGLNLSLQEIANRSHTKKQMVAKYIREQGLTRPKQIRGKNGVLYASKKNDNDTRLPGRLLKLTAGISDEWADEITALARKIEMANDL